MYQQLAVTLSSLHVVRLQRTTATMRRHLDLLTDVLSDFEKQFFPRRESHTLKNGGGFNVLTDDVSYPFCLHHRPACLSIVTHTHTHLCKGPRSYLLTVNRRSSCTMKHSTGSCTSRRRRVALTQLREIRNSLREISVSLF